MLHGQRGDRLVFLRPGVTTEQMIDTHREFCNNLAVPNVVDPTDAPSDTAFYDNLPAIISGIGGAGAVEPAHCDNDGQAYKATPPQGLVQNFDGLIRMGLMSFNFNGSDSDPVSACR